MTRRVAIGLMASASMMLGGAQAIDPTRPPAQSTAGAIQQISYQDARPILELFARSLPADLAAMSPGTREAAWPGWASRRNAGIRARLAQGDEDSIVNLLLFGTSFTKLPRAVNDSSRIGGRERAAEVVRGRITDLITAIDSPGANERLQFVRDVLGRRGINPATAAAREQARQYLLGAMKRVNGEVEGYLRAIESARSGAQRRGEMAVRSTLYRTRGLASDTSIRSDFATDRALASLRTKGLLDPESVRRVAVIGPGLDFTDKAEGWDFYPEQTTQPFAVIDSLRRHRLAHASDLRVTTLDVSPRVNDHLHAAQRRAREGIPYVVVLPRDLDSPWQPDLVAYWRSFGSSVGEGTNPPAPPSAARVDVRAVRIRPDAVAALGVSDLNVVLERLAPLRDVDRFDLIVATNVLVYYDVFEQALAAANIAAMLRPGGILLSNNVIVEVPTTPIRSVGDTTVVYGNRPDDSDQLVWYLRQ